MNEFFYLLYNSLSKSDENVENADKISFTVSSNVWLPLHRLSQSQSKNTDSMGANSLMSLSKGQASLN
jgi:hypothetical protein